MTKFKVGDSAIIADMNSWYCGRTCQITETAIYDELVIHTVAVGNVTMAVRDQELKEVPIMWEKEKQVHQSGGLVEFRSKTNSGLWSEWKLATLPLWHENGDTEYRIQEVEIEPHIPCCGNENRNMSGGCVSCGAPCL